MALFTDWHRVTLLLAPFTVIAAMIFLVGTAIGQTSNEPREYTVTITNQTHGQLFSPPLVFSHKKKVTFFETGQPVSFEVSSVAEGGDTSFLSDIMLRTTGVLDVARIIPPPMQPGDTRSLTLMAGGRFNHISLIAMLNPTNDGFWAIQGVRIRDDDKPLVLHANGYDAGSEPNNELCANIAGPICAIVNGSEDNPIIGEGKSSTEGGEGFIHVHGGIHGIGDLPASDFDWKNPVAKITIQLAK